MGQKREKSLKLEEDYSDHDKPLKSSIPFPIRDDDDDEEGNEDLSSKIVAKALSRACNSTRSTASDSNGDEDVVKDHDLKAVGKTSLRVSKSSRKKAAVLNGNVVSVVELNSASNQVVEAGVEQNSKKALLRASKLSRNKSTVQNGNAEDAKVVAAGDAGWLFDRVDAGDLNSEKKVKKVKKKKKVKQIEYADLPEFVGIEDEKEEKVQGMEIVASTEPHLVEKPVTDCMVVEGADASAFSIDDVNSEAKVKKEKRKKKDKKIEYADLPAYVGLEEEEEEVTQAMEIAASTEPNADEKPDNIILRKLLRGRRYFDPPDSSWGGGACFNCGEDGHSAVNCTEPKRIKPCFVCGSLEHSFKQCPKGQDCYICKKGGHRAKDCPEKNIVVSQSSKMCLICGHSGHDMFACRNDYSPDDLKEIQCYVCNSFGHLCCTNSINASPGEISCYKCGLLGHTGLACSRPRGENAEPGTPSSCYRCGEGGHFARECANPVKASARPRVESSEAGPPSSCYRCGEEGHFARECVNSTKASARPRVESSEAGPPSSCYRCGEEGHFARECVNSTKLGKRSHEYSTPKHSSKGNKSYGGYKSEPRDLGKAHKKKKMHYEENDMTTPRSFKPRGGWITEDPGDYDYRSHKENNWRTPESYRNSHRYSAYNGGGGQYSGGGHYAGSQFSEWSNYSRAPTSQQSGRAYNYGASAPRYGNSSSDGRGRNNEWW